MPMRRWGTNLDPRPVGRWFRARRQRELGGMLGLAILAALVVGWSLRDPWPAREFVAMEPHEIPMQRDSDGMNWLDRPWDARLIWERATTVPSQTFPPPIHPDRALSHDGRTIAEGQGSNVVARDARSGAVVGQISVAPQVTGQVAYQTEVARLAFDPDDQVVRVAVRNGGFIDRVVVWNIRTGSLQREPLTAAQQFRPIATAPDSRLGAFEGRLGAVHVWDLVANRAVGQPLAPTAVEPIGWGGAEFSADGQTLLVARGLRRVEVWDLATSKLRRVLQEQRPEQGTARLVIAPDGRTLAWVTFGSSPTSTFGPLWDELARWFPNQTWFRRHRGTLRSVALFDLATGHPLGRIDEADYPHFSPDSRFLATWNSTEKTFAIRPIPQRSHP